MDYRKVISLIVGFCILLAPMASGAAMLGAVPMHHDGHAAAPLAMDCHEAVQTVPPKGEESGSCAAALHACCSGFAAAFPAPLAVHHSGNTDEPIGFAPALHLLSRAEGIFKPPRLNS